MSTKVSKLDNFSENFNLNANYMTSVRSIYTKPFGGFIRRVSWKEMNLAKTGYQI